MGRYCTKEGKNDEKVKFSLQITFILKAQFTKQPQKQDLVVLLALQDASGEPSFSSDKTVSKIKI